MFVVKVLLGLVMTLVLYLCALMFAYLGENRYQPGSSGARTGAELSTVLSWLALICLGLVLLDVVKHIKAASSGARKEQ